MPLDLKTAPATEPISTADAKSHLRVDVSDDDTLIDGLVTAAREHVEGLTRRALIDQTWYLVLDRFPASDLTPIVVPLPPLKSVSSITYVDTAGTTQTWAASKYDVDSPSGPKARRGRIAPAFDEVYPDTREQLNAVTIEFIAGYGAGGANVPEPIILGMKLLVGHWYEHRESVVVGART